MKLTNLVIIFFLIEISLCTVIDIRINHLAAMTNAKLEYNRALDSAVDDGITDLVEVDSKRNIKLNKDAAVNQFYQSLFANFGVIGNGRSEQKLKRYIPIILVTDSDGFYLYYYDTYVLNGDFLTGQKWSEKMPYCYKDKNLFYRFTLGSFVTIYDEGNHQIYEGDYKDLANNFPDSLLADEETYHIYRRNAIIEAIEKSMNYYINKYNKIAYQNGITYQFWLPQIDKTDWYQTIDDISMLVIFQGYPFKTGSFDTYNRYALGGARINKRDIYYITEPGGVKYYHKPHCPFLENANSNIAFYTKEECALEGAYPCQECEP